AEARKRKGNSPGGEGCRRQDGILGPWERWTALSRRSDSFAAAAVRTSRPGLGALPPKSESAARIGRARARRSALAVLPPILALLLPALLDLFSRALGLDRRALFLLLR